MIWSPAQQRAAWSIILAIAVYGAVRLSQNPRYISDPQTDSPDPVGDLADRLDPNNADWRELAAIPNLGEKKAQAIVAYREAHKAHSHGPVFHDPDDLMLIRGIGYATATKLTPYLIFPTTAASTTKP